MSGNVENARPTKLSPNELELASGGLSFNYSAIEWTYDRQKSEGSEPRPKPGH